MEEIHVLRAPKKEAFNKNRRVSDLVRSQVNHFKHLEYKLPREEREKIPQHGIVTEDDAARYIAAMTRYLRRSETGAKPVAVAVPTSKRSAAPRAEEGLALAASADSTAAPAPGKGRKRGAGKKDAGGSPTKGKP